MSEYLLMWFVAEEFHLPMGLFLMLGFSKKEEALLKNATGSGVAEAIPPLQQLFRSIANNLGVSILRFGSSGKLYVNPFRVISAKNSSVTLTVECNRVKPLSLLWYNPCNTFL